MFLQISVVTDGSTRASVYVLINNLGDKSDRLSIVVVELPPKIFELVISSKKSYLSLLGNQFEVTVFVLV